MDVIIEELAGWTWCYPGFHSMKKSSAVEAAAEHEEFPEKKLFILFQIYVSHLLLCTGHSLTTVAPDDLHVHNVLNAYSLSCTLWDGHLALNW